VPIPPAPLDKGGADRRGDLMIFNAYLLKYQMQTQEFLRRFENNELQHTLDFDEWMGEAWMLEALLQDKEEIEEIEFVD
jgi:hypothetical protein